jgi:LuxR family maltose regulon positive regulatory protein
LVPRPRLFEKLSEGAAAKLILVSAPAGFGKSTLISEWATFIDKSVTWLSLDENDNNLRRFLSYLVAAFQQIDSSLGETILPSLEVTDNPPVEQFLSTLINEIAVSENEFLLVLDDYHLISSQTVHDCIVFLLDHLPPNALIVISGRVDPPISLSRYRGSGQMIEIRSNDLRFTELEARKFLNELKGLDLLPEHIMALLSRTEGWITGLQMAAISMQGRDDIHEFVSAFSGSHHYIIDYLVDEVMSRQSEEIQAFLCQTSIMNRFNASMCNAVLEITSSKEILQHLNDANLFLIPLDNKRNWYRYHHLFSDFLNQRLRENEPENVLTLHRRASEWLEQNQLIIEAIDHSLVGEDYPRAAHFVENIGPDMMMRSDFDQLEKWLDAMPQELVESWPWLCIIKAWMCQRWARINEGEKYLQAAERALMDFSVPEPVGGEKVIRGQVAAIRALFSLVKGQISQSIEYANHALEYLPEGHFNRAVASDAIGIAKRLSGDFDGAIKILKEARRDSLEAGNRILAQAIMLELGRVQTLQGRLTQAAETFREAVRLEYRKTHIKIPYASTACVNLANILREWDDLDAAQAHLEEGIRIGKPAKMVDAVTVGYAILARVHLSSGNIQEALKACKTAEKMVDDIPDLESETKIVLLASRVHLLLAQNQTLEARRYVHESGFEVNDEITFFNVFGYITLAHVLIYAGREVFDSKYLSDAQSLLDRMLEIAKPVGYVQVVITILVYQALAYKAQGLLDQALGSLKEAITLAEPEGYMRTFIDEGAPMRDLLRQVDFTGIAKDYVGKLLTSFPRDDTSETFVSSQPMMDPLSERELDVLELLATDLSGPEIADELVVSLNTMRTHTKNIYSKLGVNNRRTAVRQAKELKLI